jgi:peptidoglycan/xylan/chitin deacetylase (PgdA/CDA1 family)
MKTPKINILTYHSISEGIEPTCTSHKIFRQQLDILEACEYKAIPLSELPGRIVGRNHSPARLVVITFDDGYADFATTAFPELRARGWSATVFLPAAKIGGVNDWDLIRGRARQIPLMAWDTVSELGHQGIELGSHAMSHNHLTRLSHQAACEEIANSRRLIETITGCSVTSFAAPYGATNSKLREEIKKSYRLAVNTRLAIARPDSDPYNLPRIDMCYFRNTRRWREYLEQGSTSYFRLRKALRTVRVIATADWR